MLGKCQPPELYEPRGPGGREEDQQIGQGRVFASENREKGRQADGVDLLSEFLGRNLGQKESTTLEQLLVKSTRKLVAL